MRRLLLRFLLLSAALPLAPAVSYGQADLEINTPAINSLRAGLKQRHPQLAPYYASGAVGLTREGLVAVRDANLIPLPSRGAVNGLVAAENQDRNALYREIARANGRPDWEADIRSTFAQRWVALAPGGVWYQSSGGAWVRK
ncbi:MAG: YdbL family protein [Betaproteobacteria bacterium]|nr:YdbL family protein [Betaproteobacteria bacterium]